MGPGKVPAREPAADDNAGLIRRLLARSATSGDRAEQLRLVQRRIPQLAAAKAGDGGRGRAVVSHA